MAWSNLSGGDHEGDNWTVPDGTTIGGNHYNIATFTIESGDSVTLSQGVELEIHAETITGTGATINGLGKGYLGATTTGGTGAGTGGGAGTAIDSGDAGGGGYGGSGGSTTEASGGSAYGTNNIYHIQMGSGGGDGDGLDGGNGGGCIKLYADTMDISGSVIDCDGARGANGSNSGGGGGSGGGILIVGNTIDLDSATITAEGGDGGNETTGTPGGGGAGGSGGGGRVKIFYYTSLSNTGTTISVINGPYGAGGVDGTSYNGVLAECNATYSIGQLFSIDTGFPTAFTSIKTYVDAVTTAGDFTLSIYESTSKVTTYGTATSTISAVGDSTFTFASTIQLPSSVTEYYMEIVPDSTGDVKLSITGYSNIFDGSMYYSGYPSVGYDLYLVVTGYSHINGPSIYNTADNRTVCDIANSVLSGAVHRINRDGSGSVTYANDFTDEKYLADAYALSGTTYDAVNDELDIADDGYIYWKVDTKYPIAGIPILTAQIELLLGQATIQISLDGSTWYDIDTSIVNDISTEYDLENLANLNLKGETVVWFRIDCAGVGTNTCTVKNLEFYTDIITTHAELPIIDVGYTGNTFQLNQDSGSAINCTLELEYRDRRWL
jgi:hypothetical protein